MITLAVIRRAPIWFAVCASRNRVISPTSSGIDKNSITELPVTLCDYETNEKAQDIYVHHICGYLESDINVWIDVSGFMF